MSEMPVPVKRRRWLRRESNPLLVKELRGRMRGARAFVVLTVYLLLLSCFTSLIYYAYTRSSSTPGSGPQMAYLGKTIFSSVVLIELFLVSFITPAFTAGAISGEREHRTYEVLRTTLLPARRLVSGKLTSALTYVFLLILAALPLESLAFMLGGVVVEELVLALVVLLVTAFAFASMGLFCSSLARTTLVSTVLSYGTVVLVTIGFPILILVFSGIWSEPILYGSTPPTSWQIVLVYVFYGLISASPITAAVLTETTLEQYDSVWYFRQSVGSGPSILIPSAWTIFTALYVTLALVLLVATALRVRRQEVR
jgi:ABC-type transport system involved in multi-copper enzyme maturation permease subunit